MDRQCRCGEPLVPLLPDPEKVAQGQAPAALGVYACRDCDRSDLWPIEYPFHT